MYTARELLRRPLNMHADDCYRRTKYSFETYEMDDKNAPRVYALMTTSDSEYAYIYTH